MTEVLEKPTALDAVVLNSILEEKRGGRDPLVTYESAPPCLEALGRGKWSPAAIRDLVVLTWVQGGRNTAPLSRFLAAADEHIARRRDRPNLKVRAAAKARSTRGGKAA